MSVSEETFMNVVAAMLLEVESGSVSKTRAENFVRFLETSQLENTTSVPDQLATGLG